MFDEKSDQQGKEQLNDNKSGGTDDSGNHSLSRRLFVGGTLLGLSGAIPSAVSAAVTPDVTAVSSGAWSDSGTWDGGVPGAGDHVTIQEGVSVTLGTETARLGRVHVDGTLSFQPGSDSHLQADTLESSQGSSVVMGTADQPIAQGVEARVTFVDTGAVDMSNPDAHEQGRGLLIGGDFTVHGAEKTSWTTLANHPTAGDTTLDLSASPTNWQQGDQLVVPGVNPDANEDEERTVSAVDGSTVELDSALEFDHSPPKSGLDSYALNLTRNVVFASESAELDRRGHGMVMSQGTDVRYAAFEEMGRTDKSRPFSDPVRGTSPTDANVKARYPFHYHHTGIEAGQPHSLVGCVANGAPGWGFVNHHAYAHITDCVTYDVLGAGFVTEGGNERGSFERNFALRSQGSGETIDSRAAGAHGGDPAIDDFGHAGHGFWFQSPLTEVRDNVAAGHRHQAFVWWLRPLLEGDLAEGSTIEDSRVTYWPNLPMKYVPDSWSLLEAIEQQRFSTDSKDQLMWDTQKVPSTFAPLNTVKNNTAFGSAGGADFSRHNFKWKHERVSDFSVLSEFTVYNIGRFVDAEGDVHEPNPPRHMSSGHQGRGGNVGISFRYTSNVTLENSHLIGSGLDNSSAYPFHDYRWNNVVESCTFENWDWALISGEHDLTWVRNSTFSGNNYDAMWTYNNVGPLIMDGNDFDRLWHDFEMRNQKASEVLDTSPNDGVVVNGRTIYAAESAADYVPFPDADSLDGINNIEKTIDSVDDETNLIGLTNQEMQDQYGISVGGALMPSDATSESWLGEAMAGPASRSPPTSLTLDAKNAGTMGGWTVVSEPDAAHGEALRADGTDEPAKIAFDCASGTYEVKARIWPDSWNGDNVDFRIDGGTWKYAEKLRDPASFRWHDAAPNGGDEYTWELSEGAHTLEFRCGNDGVKIDEILITSDAQTYGAYGQSGTTSENVFGVSTESPTVDSATSATLNGTLNDLGGASSADCYFEWREVGASIWNATATQSLSSAGSYSASLDSLQEGVEYEYRGVGDAADGDTDAGSIVSFTTSDSPPTVTTGSASSVSGDGATISGSLDDLGNADSADVYVEYREAGASSWTATAKQTLSSTGNFSEEVTGLSSGTDYEFRAAADGSDGDSDVGDTASFTTDSSTTDSAPTVDSYSVSEAGSPNPHAEITARWAVSDADGNLDSVETTVSNSSGKRVDSATSNVSGSTASGTEKFKIKHADGQSFEVSLTVTDASGKSSSKTKTVTA